MTERPYLTVTYRDGKFVAAYLDLRKPEGRVRTKRLSGSVLLDIDAQGNPVGIELLSKEALNAETLNALLAPFGMLTIHESDLKPAQAA